MEISWKDFNTEYVGPTPRIYNKDPWPAEIDSRESLETADGDDWEEMAKRSVEFWKAAYEEKTLRVKITVLKSVDRIRLVKTVNPNARV
jgi:hypothetical protein